MALFRRSASSKGCLNPLFYAMSILFRHSTRLIDILVIDMASDSGLTYQGTPPWDLLVFDSV